MLSLCESLKRIFSFDEKAQTKFLIALSKIFRVLEYHSKKEQIYNVGYNTKLIL